MNRHSAICAAAVATGLLTIPAASSAATASLDKPCYVEGAPMIFAASGFSNGATITASDTGNGVFASTPGPSNGTATGTLIAPIQPNDGPTAISNNVLTVNEDLNPANVATVPYSVVNFAASSGTSIKSPKKKRTWEFSGFTPGLPVYGHFRRGSKKVSDFKFGVASAPCGRLTKKAAGLPKAKHIKSGTYKVQIDNAPKYHGTTRPAYLIKIRVFKTFK